MLRPPIQITDQDARSISLIKGNENTGQIGYTKDGRRYAYALAGAVDLAPGKVNIPVATTANHTTQTGTANAIGSTVITYTIGATAAAADLYAGGYFAVTDGTGPCLYRIKSNTVVASGGGSITVTLDDDEGLTVATTTSSKFSLFPSPFRNNVVATASSSLQASGVSNVTVTAAYSYWSQVRGYCSVLSDGIIAKNVSGILSPSVGGAIVTEGTSGIVERISYAPEATVDTKYFPQVLTIQN